MWSSLLNDSVYCKLKQIYILYNYKNYTELQVRAMTMTRTYVHGKPLEFLRVSSLDPKFLIQCPDQKTARELLCFFETGVIGEAPSLLVLALGIEWWRLMTGATPGILWLMLRAY